jgi:hypothetical protein
VFHHATWFLALIRLDGMVIRVHQAWRVRRLTRQSLRFLVLPYLVQVDVQISRPAPSAVVALTDASVRLYETE